MSHRSGVDGVQRGLGRAFVVAAYVEGEDGRLRPVGVEECPFGEGCRVSGHGVRRRKTGPSMPLAVCRCAVHERYFTVYPPGYVPYGRQRVAPLSVAGQPVGAESAEAAWRGSWWIIPAEVAKNGEANRVPLSPQVRKILDQLRLATGGGEHVLPSPFKKGASLTSLKTVNDTIVRRTKMRPWTPHDLRRTAASKMRAIGTDRRVLQAILNHKDRSGTAVYDRYAMDREKQGRLRPGGGRVEEIVGGGPAGTVVELAAVRELRTVRP